MKKYFLVFALILSSISFAACGSGPSVSAVPVTAPWDSMNLPIKEKARVWGSNATELKVVHPDDKPTVLSAYQQALMANGWKPVSATTDGGARVNFQKDGRSLELYIYDFEKTGAILTLK